MSPGLRQRIFATLLLASLPLGQVGAQATDPADRLVVTTEAFLAAHPDLRYRLMGLDAFEQQKYDQALHAFSRAARYADKPAQSMLAEMHWKGTGTARDRAMAYVWMDLAAERGYPLMIAKRENYWGQLDAAEKARALELGTAMYEEFGDEAAKPRIERVLNLARRNVTGSRVGSVGNLSIQVPTAAGTRTISGHDYYDRKFWQPELYFQWQDHDWQRKGQATVEVGEIDTSPDDSPAD